MGEKMSLKEIEYKALRDEIINDFKSMDQVFLYTVVITVTILSLCIKFYEDVPFLLLMPVIVIIPFGYRYVSKLRAIIKMGAYIEAFIESGNKDIGWESRHRQIHISSNKFFDKIPYYIDRLFTISIFWVLLIVCLSLSYATGRHNYSSLYIAIFTSISILLMILITIWFVSTQKGYHEYCLNEWNKMRK
jgi:hypothetical protein